MSKWKKTIAFLLLTSLLLPLLSMSVSASPDPAPSVLAESAILIEAESGSIVYEKNAQTRLPMASTTKIMTALVALEMASPDLCITVDPAAVGVEGSSIYLTAGEVLTLEQLLYALLLESANDAAVAISIGLCASVEAFAEKMNEKASALGLSDTHFVNPHGLDGEEHYTTAHDLALIAREAMKNELFRRIVATRKTTVPHAEVEDGRLLVNHNKLLRTYESCVGIKTGFTKRSGRCLVSAATRDGITVIAVTLNDPDDWKDHTALLDYGLSRYRSVLLCDAEAYRTALPVVGGEKDSVTLCNDRALRVTLPLGHGVIEQTVEMPRFEYAAIGAGEHLGRVVFRCDTDGDGIAEVIGELPLISCEAVAPKNAKKSFWQWLCALFGRG